MTRDPLPPVPWLNLLVVMAALTAVAVLGGIR